MHNNVILLTCSILIFPPFNLIKSETDYCSIDCADGQSTFIHTVCLRNFNCDAENECLEIPPDSNFRNQMIKSHNEYRNFIANGSNSKQFNHYKNPGAKNMNAVSYDMELEYIARCWANTCTTGHDECRDVNRFNVGQNIYWGVGPNLEEAMGQRSILFWFRELEFMTNLEWIKSFPGTNGFPNDKKQRLHFTQMIWADTQYIGCARIRLKRNNNEGTLICNYGPSGNLIGLPVYHVANNRKEIASECSVTNRIWTSLCGELNTFPEGRKALMPPPIPPRPRQPNKNDPAQPPYPDCSNPKGLTPDESEYCARVRSADENNGSCIIYRKNVLFSTYSYLLGYFIKHYQF